MNDSIDKIGELLVQYDEILDKYNMIKLCSQLEKNDKIVDLCDIMIKKYKGNLSNELLNYFILNLFIIYDKNTQIKNKDKCFQSLEKVIEDYSGSLSNMNLKIYMDMIINLYK